MFKMAAQGKGKKGEQATENKANHMFSFSMFNRLHNLDATSQCQIKGAGGVQKNLLLKDEK